MKICKNTKKRQNFTKNDKNKINQDQFKIFIKSEKLQFFLFFFKKVKDLKVVKKFKKTDKHGSN